MNLNGSIMWTAKIVMIKKVLHDCVKICLMVTLLYGATALSQDRSNISVLRSFREDVITTAPDAVAVGQDELRIQGDSGILTIKLHLGGCGGALEMAIGLRPDMVIQTKWQPNFEYVPNTRFDPEHYQKISSAKGEYAYISTNEMYLMSEYSGKRDMPEGTVYPDSVKAQYDIPKHYLVADCLLKQLDEEVQTVLPRAREWRSDEWMAYGVSILLETNSFERQREAKVTEICNDHQRSSGCKFRTDPYLSAQTGDGKVHEGIV